MKKAFTMVEVIFVIVIIGILAAVAIPKLAASRDDAEASVCIREVGQLIEEIVSEYAKVGYATFKDETISLMTNIQVVTANETRGLKIDNKVDTVGIVYICGDEEIVNMIGQSANGDYDLNVTLIASTSPVSQIAAEGIAENILGGSSAKIFGL